MKRKASPDLADMMATKLFARYDCFAESFTVSRSIVIGEIAKTYRAAFRAGEKSGEVRATRRRRFAVSIAYNAGAADGKAAEREECAKIAGDCPYIPSPCMHCRGGAEAIRERGAK